MNTYTQQYLVNTIRWQ